MKIGFLITARMKSTRLPKKITLKVDGKELIFLMISRLKQCKSISEIVIATSTNPQDDILCEVAEREGIKFFRGSEDDVLDRLYNAAKKYGLDYVINATADCPLVAVDFVDEVIKKYRKTDADLITTSDLPVGLFFYGIKIAALKKVLEIKKGTDTEVWGGYFIKTGLFNVVNLEIPKNLQRNYRLTLDYPEDFEVLKAVYTGLGKDSFKKSAREIIEFLDKHPEIVKINAHCHELYKKRVEEQAKVE